MAQGKGRKCLKELGLLVLLCLFAVSCVPHESREVPAPQAAPSQPQVVPQLTTEVAEDIYPELRPLSPAQCGQCHPTVYNNLRTQGERHRFPCQDCHEIFHTVEKVMPDCANCHTLPHGPQFPNCLSCHEDPHTPLRIPLTDLITGNCALCHTSPADQLTRDPSRHTEQACTDCHYDRHGYIPSCLECHGPHFAGQPAEACITCHPAHKPLNIVFAPNERAQTCADCHSEVYQVWLDSPSRHRNVNCAQCHAGIHGAIPACTTCHPQPHSERILEAYPNCLTCHLDAHNPPVRSKP